MKTNLMYPSLQSVAPLAEYELLLAFENGERRILDVKPYLNVGVFAALKDERLFNSVHVSFDTIQWANGADLCPEVLYAQSRPVEANRLPTATEVAGPGKCHFGTAFASGVGIARHATKVFRDTVCLTISST